MIKKKDIETKLKTVIDPELNFNIIDLGFEDARTAGWRARFIDIYLMD